MRLSQTHFLNNGMKRGREKGGGGNRNARVFWSIHQNQVHGQSSTGTTLGETTGHDPSFSGRPPRSAAFRLGSGVGRRGSRGGEGALVAPPALLVHKYLPAAALHAAERSVAPAEPKPTRANVGDRADRAGMRMSERPKVL
ncbi:hypothetical protein BHE74_00053133 [Ensete ventricosum]|nr:hypothetical protein BHE74_00053133 [Ensete ventricosum]RZS23630.1 hypothetical protein BHM03_00056596 [Ensete ventricosum]